MSPYFKRLINHTVFFFEKVKKFPVRGSVRSRVGGRQ